MIKPIFSPPKGEHIVALIEHQGRILLATNKYVYRLEVNRFKRLEFEFVEKDEA